MKKPSLYLSMALVAAVALAAPLAGCGGDDGDSDENTTSQTSSKSYGTEPADTSGDAAAATAGSQILALAADPDGAIAFDKTALEATAGKANIDFENASSVPHAVEIEGNGIEAETETVTGGSATLAVDLKPGTYEFYCPIGDHKEEGMEGVLTVK